MKYTFFTIMLLFFCFNLPADTPVFHQDVSVESHSEKKMFTVHAVTCLPEPCQSFKLVDASGKERPYTILRKLGSKVTYFFNALPGEKLKVEIYRAKVSHKKAKVVSGVTQLVKQFNGRTIHSLDRFYNAWKYGKYAGGRFVNQIYSGHNPFGVNWNYLFMYEGPIKINHTGDWFFYTASTDASFLLIDDKLVCSWPGRHWVGHGLHGHYGGKVHLKKGLHRIKYLHANHQGSCFAIAAYRLAEQKKLQVIPQDMFTPVLKAQVGELKKGSKTVPSFTWHISNMLELGGKQMYQLDFKSIPETDAEWDFGDGTKGKGKQVIHFYFEQMMYPVSMKTASSTIKETVSAVFQYSKSMITGKAAEKMVTEALRQEQSIGIQSEGYHFLANFILKHKLTKFYDSFYTRLIKKQDSVPAEVIFQFFFKTELQKRLQKEDYADGAAELKKHISRLKDSPHLSEAYLAYAQLLFYCLRNYDEAPSYAEKIVFAKLAKERQIEALILGADIALLKQGYDEALTLYHNIKSFTKKQDTSNNLLFSGAIINVRNALIQKRYEDAKTYLMQIETAQPEMRLNPELMLIKATIFKNTGRPNRAVICYEKVLALNPSIADAAVANLALAEFYIRENMAYKAKKYLKSILLEAPRSRQAVAARKMLMNIKHNE